jgi:hypothetical protein
MWVGLALLAVLMMPAHSAWAQARSRAVAVPVQIGVGPAGYIVGAPNLGTFRLEGPVVEDQLFHTGLRIYLAAIIDKEFVRQNPQLIPRQYRRQIMEMGEVRVSPMVANLIPSSLIISPKVRNTGIYGVTWRLIGIGLAPVSDPVRVSVNAGALATYAYMHSDTFANTHFLRPGLEGALDIEIPFTNEFLMSFGWASQFYLPQRVGASPIDFGAEFDSESIWHMGQLYLQFHFRVPYMYEP